MEKNSDLLSIGARISDLRDKKGITQEEFAAAVHHTRQTIAKWETGRQDFKTQDIIAIADFFNVTCDYILRGINAENVDICKKTGLSEQAINSIIKHQNDGLDFGPDTSKYGKYLNVLSKVLSSERFYYIIEAYCAMDGWSSEDAMLQFSKGEKQLIVSKIDVMRYSATKDIEYISDLFDHRDEGDD